MLGASLLAANTIILRCEARGELTFSVSIDPVAHAVHRVGSVTKVETEQLSDSVIAATSQEVTVSPANFSHRGVQLNRTRRGQLSGELHSRAPTFLNSNPKVNGGYKGGYKNSNYYLAERLI